MNNNWPTKEKDICTAEKIMQEYAKQTDSDYLGLFELIVDTVEKQMNFRLSTWVLAIAEYFKSAYGADQGDFVTRKVISLCFTNGQTLH